MLAGAREITCVADISLRLQSNSCYRMKKKFSGSLDLAILEESGKDEDTKNEDKENMIPEEKSSEEAAQEKTKTKGRRTNKAESSEESGEEQDDIMDLEEEEEMAIRFRRNSCIHGARRKSLDGLSTSHLNFFSLKSQL